MNQTTAPDCGIEVKVCVMKISLIHIASVLGFAALTGCAVVPETITAQPVPAPAPLQVASASANGAIYQGGAFRPMFEDRRARMVGDVITVAISERTSAGKSAANANNRSNSMDTGVSSFLAVSPSKLAKAGISTASEHGYQDRGSASSSNNFNGTITTSVIGVQPNGNLIISGEKQIAFDKGIEYVRFSGVVNPDTIVAGNVVPSTQVADARIEYRTNTRLDPAEMASQVSRFFLSMLPF